MGAVSRYLVKNHNCERHVACGYNDYQCGVYIEVVVFNCFVDMFVVEWQDSIDLFASLSLCKCLLLSGRTPLTCLQACHCVNDIYR